MTEQDEIRRLKELIAKQQLQLAEKVVAGAACSHGSRT